MYLLGGILLSDVIQHWVLYNNIVLNNFTTKLEVQVIFI